MGRYGPVMGVAGSLQAAGRNLSLAVLDLLPDVVWFADAGGNLTGANAAWRRLAGIAPDAEISGETFAARVHPDDLVVSQARWAASIADGSELRDEYRMRADDGRYHWYLGRAWPLRDDDGNVDGWVGTVMPFGDERAAREREALLGAVNALMGTGGDADALMEGLLAIVVPRHADYGVIDLFRPDGSFERCVTAGSAAVRAALAASRERYRFAGTPAGTSWEVARSGTPLIVDGDALPSDWSEEAERVNRGLGVSSAIVVPLADGEHHLGALAIARTGESAVAFDAADLPFYVDLAARAAGAMRYASATRDLVASERRYRTLADQLPEMVAVFRSDGTLQYANRRWSEYTGVEGDALDRAAWAAATHDGDAGALHDAWERGMRDGGRFEVQTRVRRSDGTYRWFLQRVVPVLDDRETIGSWIATATDIDERKRAEDALRVVVEAASAFAGTLDTSVALQRLADIAIAHLADWCAVHIYDEARRLRPAAIAHRDPARVRLMREYFRRYPIAESATAAVVASSGEPSRIAEFAQDLAETIDDPRQRALLASLGLRSILYVPLAADDERYGVFTLAIAESERRFTDEDVQLATLLAQRAAIAVGNARLYERQSEVARTLQASFLPPSLPNVGGVTCDAVYAPGTSDLTVGGDWYDAFSFDDGMLELSVGDVAGHGLDAAVPMGKMRQAFRALAVVERDPARILAIADSVLRREHPDIFVTAFVATFQPSSRHLLYANAGHPAPFIRSASGSLRRLETAGIPLGLSQFAPSVTLSDALGHGDLFVAFTDGLIEVTHDIDEGERFVADALAHPAFDLCSTPAALLRALVVPTIPGDDVAILTMRTGGGANWTFDANDGRAAQAAREAFVARLISLGVRDDDRLACEMVFGEIVGNVARYTPGPVDLAVRTRGHAQVLMALDRGPGFPWTPEAPRDAYAESGRGLFLIETLSREVRIEHLAGFGTYIEVALAT